MSTSCYNEDALGDTMKLQPTSAGSVASVHASTQGCPHGTDPAPFLRGHQSPRGKQGLLRGGEPFDSATSAPSEPQEPRSGGYPTTLCDTPSAATGSRRGRRVAASFPTAPLCGAEEGPCFVSKGLPIHRIRRGFLCGPVVIWKPWETVSDGISRRPTKAYPFLEVSL